MVFRIGYRPVQKVRELPPRVKLVQPEDSDLPPAERYLKHLDQELDQYAPANPYADPYSSQPESYDLVSHVFANQLADQSLQSYHLAGQIVARQGLAQRHLKDLKWRLEELKSRRPIPLRGPGHGVDDGTVNDVDKQILDLERQQRLVELELWRDLAEVRKDLIESRRQYRGTCARLDYLVGGDDAGA